MSIRHTSEWNERGGDNGQHESAPTNEQIVRLLEEVKAELAAPRKREQQIARDLARLMSRK